MILDELSVVFSADIAPFEAAVGRVCALTEAASAQADQLPPRFRSAGLLAGQGLADGIAAAESRVAAAARALADAASAALRSALEIHSPSRLTYRLGQQGDEGLARGVEDGAEQPRRAAGLLGGDTFAALKGTLSPPDLPLSLLSAPARAADQAQRTFSRLQALSQPPVPPAVPAPAAAARAAASAGESAETPFSITIPLEIDGYRLGVAAIEGINRVSRGTGRVELNL